MSVIFTTTQILLLVITGIVASISIAHSRKEIRGKRSNIENLERVNKNLHDEVRKLISLNNEICERIESLVKESNMIKAWLHQRACN